jgi:subtilase family serine protease
METNYTVQLLQEGEEKTLAVTAEVGEFLFEEMPEGEYELAIRTDRYEIVIPLQLAV